MASNQEADYIHDLQEQIDSLKDNLTYVQDNINESQSSIMQMEEAKVSQCSPKWEEPRWVSIIQVGGAQVTQHKAKRREKCTSEQSRGKQPSWVSLIQVGGSKLSEESWMI